MKLIIKNSSLLPLSKALIHVSRVVDGGMVSKDRGGPTYCFATTFTDGIVVCCRRPYKNHLIEVEDERTD